MNMSNYTEFAPQSSYVLGVANNKGLFLRDLFGFS